MAGKNQHSPRTDCANNGPVFFSGLPASGWAWEYLRRNADYRRVYENTVAAGATSDQSEPSKLAEAERIAGEWGLLCLADPALSSEEAHVFWKPDILPGALKVRIFDCSAQHAGAERADQINLSRLNCFLEFYTSADGSRHILVKCHNAWIQLYCDEPETVADQGCISIQFDNLSNYRRRLDSAMELLSLCHSGKSSLIAAPKKPTRLAQGLVAYDVIAAGGSHRDVAISLLGYERVVENWGRTGAYLEDWTRRLINRAEHLVDGGYRKFLNKKTS